jgi:hypothetical protein
MIIKINGSVIREQGLTFAVVSVKPHVIDNHSEADKYIAHTSQQLFGGIPVVLMSQDSRGTPRYYGRPDISKFLANTPFGAIPWKEYTFTIT